MVCDCSRTAAIGADLLLDIGTEDRTRVATLPQHLVVGAVFTNDYEDVLDSRAIADPRRGRSGLGSRVAVRKDESVSGLCSVIID